MTGRGLCRLLLVVKSSVYENLARAGEVGAGAVQASHRLDRLQDRHEAHYEAVAEVEEELRRWRVDVHRVMREEMTDAQVQASDLVVAVGGDGTTLAAARHIGAGGPALLGINSDPTEPSFRDDAKTPWDERRSTGALCCCSRTDMIATLGDVLSGARRPLSVARIKTVVGGEELPPSLNDVMLCHPVPSSVSRYSIDVASYVPGSESAYFHVRSSGLRVCTAMGSTAAMYSAGGDVMPEDSTEMQWMDREPIYFAKRPPGAGHGYLRQSQVMRVRWNSREGMVYVDGSHVTRPLYQGMDVELSTSGPPLQLFTGQRRYVPGSTNLGHAAG